MKHNAGFTLIEIMVALLIMSIVSAAALAGLRHMIAVKEQQAKYQQRYETLINAYAVISQDFLYAVKKAKFSQHKLHMVRTLNQGGKRIDKTQLDYVWDDHQLKRVWAGHERILIDELIGFEVSETSNALTFSWVDPWVGDLTWSFILAH